MFRPSNAITVMTVAFDVSGFTQAEVDALYLEVVVQGESSDEHPEAKVVGQSFRDYFDGWNGPSTKGKGWGIDNA